MVDPRAQFLLKSLIERYIIDGQPVGSRVLSRQSGLELSPATIRNVMADLEDMGFITSPHTSAGRVPTAKGYRFFVDSLLVVKPLDRSEISELQDQLQADRPQALVSAAAQLLSSLTQFAGVVATPRRREPSFRHIEFLSHRIGEELARPLGRLNRCVAHHQRHAARVRSEVDRRQIGVAGHRANVVRIGAETTTLSKTIASCLPTS